MGFTPNMLGAVRAVIGVEPAVRRRYERMVRPVLEGSAATYADSDPGGRFRSEDTDDAGSPAEQAAAKPVVCVAAGSIIEAA
jgi:hypothetical protein